MPISLKNLVGSGQSIEIGECVMMQDQPEPIIELDGMTFLKSGYVLTDEEAEYPEAFEKFAKSEPALDTWVPIALPTTRSFNAITFGNGIWLATTDREVLRSEDGITWTVGLSISYLRGVVYGNGVFVVYAQNGVVLTTTDGITFVEQDSGVTASLSVSIFAKGLFVLASTGSIITSSDGVSWSERYEGTASYPSAIGYDENSDMFFVSLGGPWLRSNDGISWTEDASNTGQRSFFRQFKGTWYAGATWGDVSSSPDSISWQTVDTQLPSFGPKDATEVGGHLVIVGNGGNMITTQDGINWVSRNPEFLTTDINKIETMGGVTVAVGQSGKMSVSLSTSLLGLPTLTQEGQSTQYMRIK